jgi:maltose alpha-D-glucosyltransferase/alpha-amylase
VAHYPHAAPLLGTLEYRNAAGETTTLALLQGYLDNQGDAWNFTLSYLERFLESRRMSAEPAGPPAGVHAAYLALMGTLGRRTAELHLALATRSGDPAFDPEPIAASDVATRRERVHSDLETTLALLSARVSRLPETERADVAALLARRSELAKRIAAVEAPRGPALKIRHHGDFHLGQVLLVRNDFAIIDFEGEPDRPFAERRAKGSPLRDVAGMLRSFSYAARSALAHVNSGQGNNAAADLVSLAEVWQAETEKAFVAGYREAVSGGELFSAWEDNSGLLELFLIEKALYELRYELATRLDWAVIPLRDLLAYAGSAGSR